jgi:hypothetical protein
MASRHLDPRFNPALEGADKAQIGAPVKKVRCKLRFGYVFFYGDRKMWKGPCILFLSKEEMKGQEHKLEILDNKPVVMEARVKPANVYEDLSARERAQKIEELKSELANLEAEQDSYLQSLQGRVEADKDTFKAPEHNPDAEAPQLKPTATSAVPEPKAVIASPAPEPEKPLEEFEPGAETSDGGPPPSDPEVQGRVEGPEFNPDAEAPKGGRPAGKTSRVKKLG